MTETGVRRITWRTADVARVLTLGMIFLFLWKFFWMVYPAILLGLLAVLLAMVLHTPARFLARWIPFRLAFAITVLLFMGGVAGLLVNVIPQLVEQMSSLAAQLPAALDTASTWMEQKVGARPDSQFAQGMEREVTEFLGRFVPLAFNFISFVLGLTVVVVLAIFLAMRPELYRALFLRMIAPPNRPRWALIYDEAGRNLRNWVIGKAFTMFLVGLLTWLGLEFGFQLPGALALAALAALMEFVPNLGPTIAAVPAVIAAFAISPSHALWVAVFYFVLQQVQNAITVPLIEQRAVDIPPAMLLLWQLMLAVGFGILALFVATPLLAVIVVAVRTLYVEPTEERYAWDRREALLQGAPPEAAETTREIPAGGDGAAPR